jgi:hypothetical protein
MGEGPAVRAYIAAFKDAPAVHANRQSTPKAIWDARWDWAMRYADRLDPSSTLQPPQVAWEVPG